MLRGVKEAFAKGACRIMPMADGGDGTIEAINFALGGELRPVEVTGPVARRLSASWLDLGDTCVIELAGICGISRLEGGHLEPLRSHTYGLGEVMQHCLIDGKHKLFIAVGGSASTDGGMGALRALRTEFFGDGGEPIIERGGAALSRIGYADVVAAKRLLKDAVLTVATDVTNPLLGPQGAARVFAPQKGASPEDVELLEKGLAKFADVMEATTGRHLRDAPGAGAAGGTAFGLATALDAKIVSGFEWLAQLLKLDDHMEWADLVITGEGCFDSQSLKGKVLGSLVQRCARWEKPLIVIAAKAEADVVPPDGVEIYIIDREKATDNDIADTVQKALAVMCA
jgi:glycerate kinase